MIDSQPVPWSVRAVCADHHHEHDGEQDPGRDQHLLVGQLALEREREDGDAERQREPEARALEHRDRAGAQLERLQEEDGLEALAVDAGQAEHREPEHLGGEEAGLLVGHQLAPAAVEAPDPLAPVHAVEEPVHDQQQHRDRDQPDDRLELLAVLLERAQQRLGEDPGEHRDEEAEPGADQHRPAHPAPHAHERGRDGGEDEHRLEPLAEHDDRRVGDDGRLVGGVPERRGGVGELLVEHQPRLVDLAPRRAIGDQLGEALLVDRAEPDQALDVGREPWLERLEPPLGPELEERVGLEPRLLGLLVLLGADGRLEPVERQRDQVVVGFVVRLLPLLRHRRREVVLDPLRQRVDVLGRAHALGLLGRLADDPAELGDPVLDRLRARRVALGELATAGRRARRRRRCGTRPPPGSRSRA